MGELPEGFIYRPDLISGKEERELVERVQAIQLTHFTMRGVESRRRAAYFGWLYSFDSWKVDPGPPIPDFLLPVRAKLAASMKLDAESLAQALVIEYTPGAGIGWHRDGPP